MILDHRFSARLDATLEQRGSKGELNFEEPRFSLALLFSFRLSPATICHSAFPAHTLWNAMLYGFTRVATHNIFSALGECSTLSWSSRALKKQWQGYTRDKKKIDVCLVRVEARFSVAWRAEALSDQGSCQKLCKERVGTRVCMFLCTWERKKESKERK